MIFTIGRFSKSLAVAAWLLLAAVVSADDGAGGAGHPFFALANGVADAKHPTPESQAAVLKELGYAGIGPSGTSGVADMLGALDGAGLKMFALYVGANLDADQPKYDPGLPKAIETLKGRETFVWLTIRSKTHKPSTTGGDGRAVQIVREIAELAEASGLRVALYPHSGFYVQRVEDAVRVADQVDRPNVGVTFNLCHWLKVDGPADVESRLRLAMPRLMVVTVNGADRDGTTWDRLIQPLDRGTFDVGGLLKKLDGLGYTGPVGLQCYAVPGDKEENLRRSMAAWRKLTAGPAKKPPPAPPATARKKHNPEKWERAIAAFEEADRQKPPPTGGVLFLGSSSIKLWDLERHFPGLPALNRGFGGSHVEDSAHFAGRIVVPYRPRVIVLYAGDNDIAYDKTPERVLADYKRFVEKVHAELPDTRIAFIAIKPSPKRWALVGPMREANRLIRQVTETDPRQVFVDVDGPMLGADGKPRAELFAADGLHLSDAGYRLWSDLVRPHVTVEKKP